MAAAVEQIGRSLPERGALIHLNMHQLIRIQPGSTPARAYTAPRRGETVRYRLTGCLQETVTPWAGVLAAPTLPVRLIGVVLLTDARLLFSGKFWIPRKPSRFWAINDALEGGGTNYAKRAAQFVERRDIHAVGHCPVDWINAVQLERRDTALVSQGNARVRRMRNPKVQPRAYRIRMSQLAFQAFPLQKRCVPSCDLASPGRCPPVGSGSRLTDHRKLRPSRGAPFTHPAESR
jgi:hypothetical protein